MDNRRKKIIKSSAKSSVKELVSKAFDQYRQNNAGRSRRYIKMAMDLLTKNRIRLPKELKNSFCKKCHLVWIPGKTVRVTFDKKHSCLRLRCECGYSKRI